MEQLNGYRMRIVLVGFVAAMVFSGGSAKADFTFGEPTNLGSTVNSSVVEGGPNISADGLVLFFHSDRPGGLGSRDLYVTTRVTTDDDWGTPANLGPTVNTSYQDDYPSISADSSTLFFSSNRPGGYGGRDIWVVTRASISDPWRTPANLGPLVNTGQDDICANISADGLELYFGSYNRTGGYGHFDIWVATRVTADNDWGTPVNLGPTVNSSYRDLSPSMSTDGLVLFFFSDRPGGLGGRDLWLMSREKTEDGWGAPVNLGSPVNISYQERAVFISADGSTLYFISDRPGGLGNRDIWQAPVIPIVDLNSDGIVDAADMCIMVDHWGEDYSLCDIGPMPWGDGIVDVEDLIVLAEHLFEEVPRPGR